MAQLARFLKRYSVKHILGVVLVLKSVAQKGMKIYFKKPV